MGNHGILDLVYIVLSLNIVTADQWAVTAKKHWIMETARLNQPIYFYNILTSKWNSKRVLLWERGYAFIFTGNEKL